jgi:hypothetical protein
VSEEAKTVADDMVLIDVAVPAEAGHVQRGGGVGLAAVI